jgi:hypothetical protein
MKMNYFFISVNYKTSGLIQQWADSIYKFIPDAKLIIVDNFSTIEERRKVVALSKEISFHIIETENEGYSSGLNKGLTTIFPGLKNSIIFCCNLDIEFLNIPKNFETGHYVYIPEIIESNRKNRNPFLTRFQKKLIPIYKFAANKKSVNLYLIAIILNKIAGLFKSKIWAIHGSLFCFNSLLLEKSITLPFNSESFLYAEEYEFASYIEKNNGKFVTSELIAFHHSHTATSEIISNTKGFMKYWSPSFLNFINKQV